MRLRGTGAIAGIGETRVGVVPDQGSFDMYVEAILLALKDAGIGRSQVDILATANSRTEPFLYHSEHVAEYLGIQPNYCLTTQTGGGTTVGVVGWAVSLIEAGLAKVAVISAADNLLSGFAVGGAMQSMAEGASHPRFEVPFGATVPSLYAQLAQRHMHDFGTSREQLAAVAVAARKHAGMTEKAQKRDPLTVEDVLSARPIATPLHRHDCALISDGGAAIVIVSAEIARDLAKPPVFILGLGEGHRWEYISQTKDVTETAAKESGDLAFSMSGLKPHDMKMAILYDAFSILPILFLEDLGFCRKGEGGAFVEDGRIEVGGQLPINTHGGLLSYCHPGRSGAMFGVLEAVRQVRGEAAKRQVLDADAVVVHAEGGVASTNGTMVLSQEV